MAERTPGEWEQHRHDPMTVIQKESPGYTIANVRGENEEAARANAPAIANIPNMMDTLEEILSMGCSNHCGGMVRKGGRRRGPR